MKTTPNPRNTSHTKSQSSKPLFNKSGEGAFFSNSKEGEPPFFTPSNFQTKLSIGEPGDKYEQEADTIAEKVVQNLDTTNSTSTIQNKCEDCAEEEKLQKMEMKEEEMGTSPKSTFESAKIIERKNIQGKGVNKVDTNLETPLENSRGNGQSLDKHTRRNMEQMIGADFKNVKVHTGTNAVQMNQNLGALAFTNGNNIFFNKGKYNPNSRAGNKLLAHELTHVVQQGAASQKKRKNKPASLALQTLLERDESTFSNSSHFKKEIASFQDQYPESEILRKQEMIQSKEMVGEVQEKTNRSKVQRACGCSGDGCDRRAAPTPTPTPNPPTPPTPGTSVPTVTGTMAPKDNFSGRSTVRYGVGEEIDLDFTTTATGTPPTGVGLEWTKKSGLGTVVNSGSNNGKGTFTAGDRAGRVELELKVVGGPHAGTVADTKAFDVVEPDDALMEQATGTNIRHTNGLAGVGFKGSIFLRPMDVSFNNVVMREGTVAGVGTGFYVRHNGRVHATTPSFPGFGSGNSSKGNKLVVNDTVDTGNDAPPFSVGTFDWPIPWEFKVGSGAVKQFTVATHHMEADSTGTATITKKGAGPFTKQASDPTTSF